MVFFEICQLQAVIPSRRIKLIKGRPVLFDLFDLETSISNRLVSPKISKPELAMTPKDLLNTERYGKEGLCEG